MFLLIRITGSSSTKLPFGNLFSRTYDSFEEVIEQFESQEELIQEMKDRQIHLYRLESTPEKIVHQEIGVLNLKKGKKK